MASLDVYIYPGAAAFGDACALAVLDAGHVVAASPEASDVAIAPLLRKVLSADDAALPRLGTLIFHPSALPYGRGPDAIKWSVSRGERVSAATWFWCAPGLDAGPICASEVVVLCPGESAGRSYHTRFAPAGLAALRRALAEISAGVVTRVPQDEALATYDSFFGRNPPA